MGGAAARPISGLPVSVSVSVPSVSSAVTLTHLCNGSLPRRHWFPSHGPMRAPQHPHFPYIHTSGTSPAGPYMYAPSRRLFSHRHGPLQSILSFPTINEQAHNGALRSRPTNQCPTPSVGPRIPSQRILPSNFSHIALPAHPPPLPVSVRGSSRSFGYSVLIELML
jgi:hypothetical protein